jgi:hypothetical protein
MRQAHEMVLHAPNGGLDVRHMRPEHGDLRKNSQFCDFFTLLARVFSPSSGGNFPYKYNLPHS